MMDELELLKSDWQKKGEHLPKLSYDEIYKMIRKKSSSVVKWIFYISIIELLFWLAIAVGFTDGEDWETTRKLNLYEVEIVLDIINYAVIVYFIYKFYVSYKKISVTDSSKQLMATILDTRKTVMRYVWFNLAIFCIFLIIYTVATFLYDPNGIALIEKLSKNFNETLTWILIIGIFTIIVLVILLFLWLFYKLLYGILLGRLRNNYNELKQLEV